MYLTRRIEYYNFSPSAPFILYKYDNNTNPYPNKHPNIYYAAHSAYPSIAGINGNGGGSSSQGGFFGGFCKLQIDRPTSEVKNTEIGYVGLYNPSFSGVTSYRTTLNNGNSTIDSPIKNHVILGKVYDIQCSGLNNSFLFHFNYDFFSAATYLDFTWTPSSSLSDYSITSSGFKPFFNYTGQFSHGAGSGCAVRKLELGLYVYELS